MDISTSGIVLRTTRYSDTSLIVKIYTEAQGTQSFIIKNAFSRKSRIKASFFSPLALVHITYHDYNDNRLKHIKDIIRKDSPSEAAFHLVRNTLVLFCNEVLYKLLFDSGPDVQLYSFLESEINRINGAEHFQPDFPARFLLRLSAMLGFCPENNCDETDCHFSLTECRFVNYSLNSQNELPEAESRYLSRLLNQESAEDVDRTLRNNLLRSLIKYFKIHNEQIHEIESAEILASVLHQD